MNTPHSLRLRLLAGGAVWILFALLASWLFIVATFNSFVERERRADLQVSLDRLVAAIDPETGRPLEALAGASSDAPLGGAYWQVHDLDSGRLMRSRSLWDVALPEAQLAQAGPAYFQFTPPDGPPLIVLSQLVRSLAADGTERRFAVSVAETRPGDDDPQQTFGRALAIFLAILAVALFVAAWLQVHIGLKPLGQLRRSVAAVRDGAARRLPVASAREIQPLVEQVNDLLDAQEASMEFTRERASDLAHGLKTPLAVLSATADRMIAAGDTANGPILQMLSEQMNERIEYQLRIARLRFRTRALGVNSSVNDAVLRSVAVLRKAPRREQLSWVVDLDPNLDVNMDAHDLMELMGILLENAQQWATQQVAIRGRHLGPAVQLTVEDDGKGLSDEQIERLGKRGVRLDEASSGDGLGLAIALEITSLNRAELKLRRSPLGGLEACLLLPAA